MANYIVQKGDSLSAIGAKFGVPYSQITGYRSGNPNLIYAGETLTIPDKAGATAPATTTPSPTAPIPAGGQPQPSGVNPNDANSIKAAFPGYTGWSDTNAIVADFKATGGQGKGGQTTPQPSGATTPTGASGGGAGVGSTFTGLTNQPTIDLPKLYQNLYTSSGITEKETALNQKEKQYLEAKGKISDNPFLSASTVDKRLARLQNLYNAEVAPLKNEIATKKADVETQLNLQTKQFDINSQQAKQALDQFNTLLSAGALNGASGEDIANITRATGLSSTIIQSAITASKAKNADTQVITATNDAGVVTAVTINKSTGAVISKTSLGSIGNAQNAPKPTETDKKSYYQDSLRKDASSGVPLDKIFKLYTGYIDPNEILNLYNANSSYGPAKEDYAALSKYGVKAPTGGL